MIAVAAAAAIAAWSGAHAQSVAAAGVRYAGAQGSGSACARAAPCAFADALSMASAGETVVPLSGEGPYGTIGAPLSVLLTVPEGVAIEADPEEARPVVHSAAAPAAIRLERAAAAIGIDIHYSGAGPALEAGDESSLSRMLVVSTGSLPACDLGGDTSVANTLCSGATAARTTATSDASVALRNDTFAGSQRGLEAVAGSGATLSVDVHNSIVRGGALDVLAERTGSGIVSVQLATSNFASGEAGAGTTITASGSGGNQAAPPHFVDAPGGDFRQLGDSPTVDAGENDPANGPVDLLGLPRSSSGHLNCEPPPSAITDIGAFELQPISPPCARPRGPVTPWIPPREGRNVVPRVLGLSLAGAVARLHRHGLRVTVGGWRPRCRPGAGPRWVYSQRPGAKTLVPPEARVRLLTECGPRKRGLSPPGRGT